MVKIRWVILPLPKRTPYQNMKRCTICLFTIFYFLFLTFIGCKKDKPEVIQPVNGPAIEAKSTTTYPDGGVTIRGEIHQLPSDVKEVGFVISTDSTLATYRQMYKQTSPIAIGSFKVDINTGLEKGKTYFYAPYSLTNTNLYTVYNHKSFISVGGKHVKIGSISPLNADIGDTITVKGKYLNQSLLLVRFGIQYASVYLHNDSTLKFTIPSSIDQITPLITFNYSSIIDTVTNKFVLNKPVITGFTPVATFRDTVIINGDHFNRIPELNEVHIGNIKIPVVKANSKQLKIVVPDDMETVVNSLTVKAQLQTIIANNKFSVKTPEITSITPSGYANAVNGNGVLRDIITIKGKYFNPLAYKNRVFFEGNENQILSGSTTELTTNLPQGPYPRKKATVKVKFLDQEVTYQYDVTLKDTWVMVAGAFPFAISSTAGAFTINNNSYVLAPPTESDYLHKSLWKFNAATYTWQEIKIPFTIDHCEITSTANKAYLYTSDKTNNFWEYDPALNKWTHKADYPDKVRYSSTMFSIGSNVFIGLGNYAGNMYDNNLIANNTFYNYDTITDTWKQVADYPGNDPGARVRSTSLVLNGLAFVGGGAIYTPDYKLYSYNPVNNTWKKANDFNMPKFGCFAFTYKNTGYVSSDLSGNFPNSTYRSIYKYNTTGDSWTMLSETIGAAFLGPSGFDNGFAIVNNGYVFIAGSSGSLNPQLFIAKASDL